MSSRVLCLLSALAFCAVSCSDSSSDDTGSNAGGGAAEPSVEAYVPRYKGPKVLLKAKFAPGTYTLTEALEIEGMIDIFGESMSIGETTAITGKLEITEPLPNGDQKLRFTCETLKQTSIDEGVTHRFDSTEPRSQDGALGRMLRPMVGSGAALTLGADGKFKKSEGVRFLMEQTSGGDLPDGARRKLQEQMEQFLNKALQQWGALLPQHPVGPGDTWRARIGMDSVDMLGDVRMDADCRLKDFEERPDGLVAEIVTTDSTPETSQTLDLETLGGEVLAGVSATFRGIRTRGGTTFKFDTAIGMSTAADLKLTMTGDLVTVMPDGETGEGPFSFRVRYENTLVRRR